MNYTQDTLSQADLNRQLLYGLKKHLQIAQDTTIKKFDRQQSLNNIAEVLEYVISNFNDNIPIEEQAILLKFFSKLIVNVKAAQVDLHFKPVTFNDEIAFLTVLLGL